MNENKAGLVLGCFFSFVHLVWAILIMAVKEPLQKSLDWIFEIHALVPIWKITSMTFINAVWLIVVTFIVGYILGLIFATIHNKLDKKR